MRAATAQQLILKDGRRLCFAEYGDRRGWPLIYFHGWPSSRLEAGLMASLVYEQQIHLIAPDRPGFGGSDFQQHRGLLDWPGDVAELAGALGLNRFSVLGLSGGGPYVAACALKLPQRLLAAGIVSGFSPVDLPGVIESMRPMNRRLLAIGRRAPWLLGLVAWPTLRSMKRNPSRFFERLAADLPQADQAILAREEIWQHHLQAALEAFRPGLRGAALENAIYAQPWGFELADISKEIDLWHGELDRNVPAAMGHYLATTLPACRATFYQYEGHISLFVNQMDQIVTQLKAASS